MDFLLLPITPGEFVDFFLDSDASLRWLLVNPTKRAFSLSEFLHRSAKCGLRGG